jgi:hypothetical protein
LEKDVKSLSTIERLDVREGTEWEIIRVKKSEAKIKGHSLASLQISASEILVFGSYYEINAPCYERNLFYIFDHEKLSIKNCF